MALGRAFFMFQLVAGFRAHRNDGPDLFTTASFGYGKWHGNRSLCHPAEMMIR